LTKDEALKLAKQAGWEYAHNDIGFEPLWEFADLIRADAMEAATRAANESWTMMCKKMVEFEREACATVCEKQDAFNPLNYPEICAKAIRARGKT
jgi:hypothetical protein